MELHTSKFWIKILLRFYLVMPITTSNNECDSHTWELFSHLLGDVISQVLLDGDVIVMYDERDRKKICEVLAHLYQNSISIISQEVVLDISSHEYLNSFENFNTNLKHVSRNPRKMVYIVPFCITPTALNKFLIKANEKNCQSLNECMLDKVVTLWNFADNIRWIFLTPYFNSSFVYGYTCKMAVAFETKKVSGFKHNRNNWDIIIRGCRSFFDSSKRQRILAKWSKSDRFQNPVPTGLMDKPPTKTLLQGKTIKAGILQGIPFITYLVSENNALTKIEGLEIEMMKAYAKYYQFKIDYTKPEDGQWGKEINHSWTGLIGMIQRKEVDIVLNSLSKTYWRMKVADFTYPHFIDQVIYATSTPKSSTRVSAILSPFKKNVVLAILILAIGIAFSIHILNKQICIRNDKAWNFGHTLFFLLTALTFRSEALPAPQSTWLRILIGVWWLFALIIMSAFSSILTSILNVPSRDRALDTIEDLAEAIEKKEVLPMVVSGTSSSKTLQSAESGYFKTIGDSLKANPNLNVKNVSIGLETVKMAPVALVYPKVLLESEAISRGKGYFHFSKESLFMMYYATAVPIGSPLKKMLDPLNRRFQESGLIYAWKTRVLKKQKLKHLQQENSTDESGAKITFEEMLPAFILLTIGYAVAVITFAIEIIIGKWRRLTRVQCLPK